MGWTDEHLHQFTIRGRRYGEAREGAMRFSMVKTALTLSERQRLGSVLREKSRNSCFGSFGTLNRMKP
ncbi:hypothetical protein [Cupriavidus sp. SK-4]|uniref:hypothetical protein n=1 Tax=Cupriavidus sp. SK-4 TaxID=574750 RepID=UPI000A026BD3